MGERRILTIQICLRRSKQNFRFLEKRTPMRVAAVAMVAINANALDPCGAVLHWTPSFLKNWTHLGNGINILVMRTTNTSNTIAQLDWSAIRESMLSSGFAMTPAVLSKTECKHVAKMFDQDALFRSVTNMAHKRFGSGTYKYFKYPLPDLIAEMRTSLYEQVAR